MLDQTRSKQQEKRVTARTYFGKVVADDSERKVFHVFLVNLVGRLEDLETETNSVLEEFSLV